MSKVGRGQRCRYCERVLEGKFSKTMLAATKDHTEPSYLGGTHTVWCCRFCNMTKGPVKMEVWMKFVHENPDYWRKENYDVCRRFRRHNHNIGTWNEHGTGGSYDDRTDIDRLLGNNDHGGIDNPA